MAQTWLPARTLSKEEEQANKQTKTRGGRPRDFRRQTSHRRVNKGGRGGALGDSATCVFSAEGGGEAGQAHIPAPAATPLS